MRRVQRRLTPTDVDQVLAAYRAGDTVGVVAARHGVHRTTMIGHVTHRGLPSRSDAGWSDRDLGIAGDLCAAGQSLATVGRQLGVDATTVANRSRRARVPVRARRGWA